MSFPSVTWASALFFLFALIIVRRFKLQITSVDKPSFSSISSGLILLAIFSLTKVYHQLGLFATIPFVSDATFFDVVFSIGMISGTIFLLHGVSSFMPLARRHRKEDGSHYRRLELVRKIEQLTAVESRLDVILERTLEHMVISFGFELGAVYKYSSKTDRSKLVSSSGRKMMTEEVMKNVRFNIDPWTGALASTTTGTKPVEVLLPTDVAKPSLVLPIQVNQEPAGFFLLWADERQFIDRDQHLNLKIAADIISRKIISDSNQLQYQFITRCEKLRRQIQAGLKQDQAIGAGLAQITAYLAGQLTFNLATLTILDQPGGSLRRLSVGPNHALLDEKGLAPSERRSITSHVARIARPVRVTNYADHSQTLYEDIMENARMNSALAVPIIDDHRVVAVLMIASEQTGAFRQADSTLLAYATPGLAQLVRDEKHRSTVSHREMRLTKVTDFTRTSLRAKSFEAVAHSAARLLANELKTCQIRITLVEDDATFLKSIALTSQQDTTAQVPVDGRMILSLMPCHTTVIKNAKPMIVNQSDPDTAGMPESESSQALNSSLNSAMIVPIIVGDQVYGLISIAEMRGGQVARLGAADLILTEAIAEVMSMAKGAIDDRQPATPGERINLLKTLVNDQTARGQVRSSLTGILGSIEMLRATTDHNPDNLNRYLSIIDSSAKQLNECLNDNAAVAGETFLG